MRDEMDHQTQSPVIEFGKSLQTVSRDFDIPAKMQSAL
jgi:hypothetical protein